MPSTILMQTTARRGVARACELGPVLALLALALPACNTSDLLDVSAPDIVTPASLGTPAGRDALYVGAIGDFTLAYSGGNGGGSYPDAVVTYSGIMSDEVYLSDTFPTRQEFDQRSIALDNTSLDGMFWRLQRARASLDAAVPVLEAANANDARVPELLALSGFAYVAFAENFCSGVPFSSAKPGEEPVYGQPQTTAEMLTTALARFDAALAKSSASAGTKNLALVGKARVQQDQGNLAAAAATVAAVPTTFVYSLYHTINGKVTAGANTFSLDNGLWAAMVSGRRVSVANREGQNGLPFRSLNDPRLQVTKDARGGFDSSSPVTAEGQWDLVNYPLGGAKLDRTTAFPLASGTEARLIEAEAKLKAADAPGALAQLNALRQAINLPALADAATDPARLDQVFAERAIWLYGTGHRLSDLRRLVRQYQRARESVFPTGAYLKGGSFGQDVNFPVPQNEKNNPNFTQCLDRNP